MMSRSLFRLTLLCVVFLLFLSVGSVVGKKAASSQDVDSLGGSYSNTLSEATPTLTPEQIATAAKALQRKRDLLKKRRSKSESAYAQAQRSAKQRASQLAQRRAAKATKEAKAKEAAKQRADALAAKKRQADTPEIRRKGHDKLKWLLRKSAESGSRMISLDLQSFNQYVGDGPRPYHLMIAFTALTAQYNCYYCHLADDAIRPVAIAHYERSKERVAAVLASNSTADIPDSELPVFFANVDIARNRELFSELKLSQTPYLILAPPRLGTKALKPVEFMKQLPQKYRFNLQANMAPSDFSSFINKLAGIHVNIDAVKPGFTDLLFMLVVLFGIAFVGFRYGYDILMKLREIEGIRFLVLIGGFGLYCWCISGGMYNVIRNVQWAETHKDGSTNYINGDARDQYAAEGLLIGVLNLACAFVLISMNLRSFDYGATTQTGKGAKLSPLQHLKNAIAPFFSPIVCLVLLIAFWHSVLDIYTRKNWGYRRGFVWR